MTSITVILSLSLCRGIQKVYLAAQVVVIAIDFTALLSPWPKQEDAKMLHLPA